MVQLLPTSRAGRLASDSRPRAMLCFCQRLGALREVRRELPPVRPSRESSGRTVVSVREACARGPEKPLSRADFRDGLSNWLRLKGLSSISFQS